MIRTVSGSPLRESLRWRLFKEAVLTCQCGHQVFMTKLILGYFYLALRRLFVTAVKPDEYFYAGAVIA